jgi:hypothetical protein
MTDQAEQTPADVAAAVGEPAQTPEGVATPETPTNPEPPEGLVGPVGAPGETGVDGDDTVDAEAEALAAEWNAADFIDEPTSYHDVPNPNALRGIPAGPPPHPRAG